MRSSKRNFQIDGGELIDMPFGNNKKILVTGGSEFLGSFIVDKLKEKEVNGKD